MFVVDSFITGRMYTILGKKMTQGDKDILEKAEELIINITGCIRLLKQEGMGTSARVKQARRLVWVNLMLEEFPERHLGAIETIVGFFNTCEESEAEIFEFAEHLYKQYAK